MLNKLANKHDLWLRMVINMGCPNSYAEDIVQEMYLKIHHLKVDERIMYNEEDVNEFYIFVTLRNLYYDSIRIKNRMRMVENNEEDEPDYVDGLSSFDDFDYEKEFALQRLSEKITEEIDSWEYRYDSILCKLYFKTEMSMRYIAVGSGISLTSIHNSLRNYKDILRTEFSEDVEDYNNGDYDKI
jgi:DNA-directed RNA polymerase specialized sigma24 family protein